MFKLHDDCEGEADDEGRYNCQTTDSTERTKGDVRRTRRVHVNNIVARARNESRERATHALKEGHHGKYESSREAESSKHGNFEKQKILPP